MYIVLHVKYPLFLSDLNETFLTDIRKTLHVPNFMKIRVKGTKLFHADEQTRNEEANSRLSKLYERAQKPNTMTQTITFVSFKRKVAGLKLNFHTDRPDVSVAFLSPFR